MKRWISSQQIGLLAHSLHEYSSLTPNEDIKQIRKRLRSSLEAALDLYGWDLDSLCTMPSATLYLLRHLGAGNMAGRFRSLFDFVDEAISEMFEQRHAPFSRLQDLVHHLLHAPGDPMRALRLGKSLFKRAAFPGSPDSKRSRWQEIEADTVQSAMFCESIWRLRDRRGDTRQRIAVVDRFLTLLSPGGVEATEALPCLRQVENLLLQYLFCWPLLVVKGGRAEMGFSVPLSVDIRFPSSHAPLRPFERSYLRRFEVEGAERFDLSQKDHRGLSWIRHLAHAALVGRQLWQSTHGHFGDFRKLVESSTAVFDFSAASEIVDPILSALGIPRMPLCDGSAVPYLAQVVLARLLGRRWYYPSAVTGESSLRRSKASDGRNLLDYDFISPDGILPKLIYVFITRQFHRLILPSSGEAKEKVTEFFEQQEQRTRDGRSRDFAQTAEVVQSFRQSNIADAFHVEGWRKWSYVRLPEVRWGIHSPHRPGLLEIDDFRVQRVLRAFRQSSSPILSLEGITPMAVASALWHVNTQLIPHLIWRTPPGLSWAFIRVTEDEQDSSFWRNLWRHIGAPEVEFERLRYAPTSEHAALEIARALNGYCPDRDRPSHRAPDFIVLVASRRFDQSFDGIKDRNPAHRPLAVAPILHRLQQSGLLEVSPIRRQHPELRDGLGPVRIVLLADECPSPWEKASVVLDRDKPILRPLAVFRWGFRQQMAAMVLRWCGTKGIQLRRELDDLTGRGVLRCIGGEYHLLPALREGLLQGVSDRELAKFHFAAGSAMAPYATDIPAVGLAYDVATLPEHVREARFHLQKAFRLFDLAEMRGEQMRINLTNEDKQPVAEVTKNSVRTVQQRLSRFGTFPSWGTVNDLLKSRDPGAAEEAYRMATDLIQDRKDYWPELTQDITHPIHLLQRTRALLQWQPDDEVRLLAHFQEALDACDRFPEERVYNQLQVLAYLSNFHFARGRSREADQLDEAIARQREHWQDLPGEWFERRADANAHDAAALAEYVDGVVYAPNLHQLPIKALGASIGAGMPVPPVVRQWLDQEEPKLVYAAAKAFNAFKSQSKSVTPPGREPSATESGTRKPRTPDYVIARWKAGLQHIGRVRPSAALQQALARFSSDR